MSKQPELVNDPPVAQVKETRHTVAKRVRAARHHACLEGQAVNGSPYFCVVDYAGGRAEWLGDGATALAAWQAAESKLKKEHK